MVTRNHSVTHSASSPDVVERDKSRCCLHLQACHLQPGTKGLPDGTTSLGHQRQQVRHPAGLPTAFGTLAAFVSETVGCCCLASALWAHSSSAIWHHQPQPMLFGPAAARSKHRLKQGCRIRFASCIQTRAGLPGGSQGGMARPRPSAASGMLRTSPHLLVHTYKAYKAVRWHRITLSCMVHS